MQWIRGEQSGGERDDERCNNKIIIIWQQRSERESERVNNVTETKFRFRKTHDRISCRACLVLVIPKNDFFLAATTPPEAQRTCF